MQKSRRIRNTLRTAFLLGALFCYSAAAYAAIDANALPTGGSIVAGNGVISSSSNYIVITELDNTIIKWQDFSIGKDACVYFTGQPNFNVLNYVASGGSMSQIYGTMDALGGNLYLVNPAGVFIGDGANINVGSLYVSNKKIDTLDKWQKGDAQLNTTVAAMMAEASTPQTAAELMSLGHINATGDLGVTFDGGRIVLDTEYVTKDTDVAIDADKLKVVTTDKEEVVLGYDGYDSDANAYLGIDDEKYFTVTSVAADGTKTVNDSVKGYMWVKYGKQLQALNTNKSGNYALRNDIDLAESKIDDFTPIGYGSEPFTGKLDGLDHSISNLYINSANLYNGLFGYTSDATLRNLVLESGRVASAQYSVGGLVGCAQGGVIENIINSGVNVSGTNTTGGIIGTNSGASLRGKLVNNATVQSTGANVGGVIGYNGDSNISGASLINSGVVVGSGDEPTGGVIGYNDDSDISGASLINSGVVVGSGDAGTGGVIGNNYQSNISKSSLIATESSVVIGNEHVGGLIGRNKEGTVEGGRDAKNNYYAYQIYNSGLVIGGSYKEKLEDDDDKSSWMELYGGRGYYKVSETSSDIGGLIGWNVNGASLSAAYNTGSVQGGEYVGGIVGYNGGRIDQVFNIGSVQGKKYAGGIVGYAAPRGAVVIFIFLIMMTLNIRVWEVVIII